MKKSFAFIFSVLLTLGGCGSSSTTTTSGPTLTTGLPSYESAAPKNVSTLAGTALTMGTADGIGPAARFHQPDGVVVSPDSTTLYVTDFFNNNIRSIVLVPGPAFGTVSTVPIDTVLNGPHNIATDGTNLYVAEFTGNKVRKIVIATGAVSTLAGTGVAGADNGAGSVATFSNPSGIAISPDHAVLYVTDFSNGTIRTIATATGDVGTLSTPALASPAGIVADSTGNLYVTQFGNRTISKVVIATGVVTTLAGSPDFYGSTDGTGTAASFLTPNGIALLNGSLYVTDTSSNTIRKIVISSGVVTTVAGTPAVSGAANGTGAAAGLFSPYGIATDGTRLFVGDYGNGTVREIQ